MMLPLLKTTFLVLACSVSFGALAQAGNFTLADWPTTAAPLKPVYVKAIMEQAGIHQVTFKQDANFYVAELDKFVRFAQENNYRLYLKTSVAQNLATIAVVNCDWNNGVAPWEFAQQYLGNDQLQLLTPLYAAAIDKLQKNCEQP